MPVPRRRHSSARRRKGRTHKKMNSLEGITSCPSCSAPRLQHRVCPSCGEFKGRVYGKSNTKTSS